MRVWSMMMLALLAAGAAKGQPGAPAHGATPPVDYTRSAAWICRPDVGEDICAVGLDAMAIDTSGRRTPAPFVPARNAPIDCFYVYPTASGEPTLYSDLAADEGVQRAVRGQAARLGAVCRLYVPAYHQFTSAGLHYVIAERRAGDEVPRAINDVPYRDILAAWRSYLAHDNHGRGVVLVGHSQGAMLLKRLIAEQIDGRPAQRLLVAAYLAGNDALSTRSFASIGPCGSATQTGCVVAWSSYRDGYAGDRVFGGAPGSAQPICVNPAAPAGGRALLKSVMAKPAFAPAEDPPFVELIGQESAECVVDARSAVLRVRVEPGPLAPILSAGLARIGAFGEGWGLHPLDISLVEGNMIDLIASQGAAWSARH
jgi:predicted alpha/beta hydrolase family esterase